MKFTSEKKTIFFFTIAAIALISVLVIFFTNTQMVKSTSFLVDHTQDVLRRSDNVLIDILNLETGSRGFVITGDELFLKPFNNSVATIYGNIDALNLLTLDNRNQQLRLSWLKTAVDERFVFTKFAIKARREKGFSESQKVVASGEGRKITEKIRSIIKDIDSEELRLLKLRKNENEKANKNNELIFLILLSIIILFIVIIIKNQKVRTKFAEKEKQASVYARSLLEASLDPLVTINADGKITDVNNESVNVTGFSREELVGTNFSNYFTEPLEAQEGYRQAFEKGFVADYPLTIKHKNGKMTEVVYNASVYKDDKGNVLGVFAAARDITKSKIAQRQLEAVNKELEAFSYSVSHDLRAPLRAINGYANILQEDYSEKIDKEGNDILLSIHKNSKKMGELIDDLLAFSRLGKKELTFSEINMSTLVKSVKDTELMDKTNDIEFVINELLSVKGQQALIKQVWVNLISNAVKYSQHNKKARIEIGSYWKDTNVIYYVKDNGAGFDMQYYDKLFGVFQRLHSNEEFEGTGIGLAIVQKIINRHKGEVWAESKVNEGSIFYFSLPDENLAA